MKGVVRPVSASDSEQVVHTYARWQPHHNKQLDMFVTAQGPRTHLRVKAVVDDPAVEAQVCEELVSIVCPCRLDLLVGHAQVVERCPHNLRPCHTLVEVIVSQPMGNFHAEVG